MTLQASGLAIAKGHSKLFTDVGFELAPGQALRVQGNNGSGKTSLLRVLCGLAQPLRGEVRWQGRRIDHQRARYQQLLGYLGHAQGLKAELTALESVRFGALVAGRACSQGQALAALQGLGLLSRAHLPVRALSMGQRRRVLLARLTVPPTPALLVLDEPFTALDQASAQAVGRWLEAQVGQGAIVIYTTHQGEGLE